MDGSVLCFKLFLEVHIHVLNEHEIASFILCFVRFTGVSHFSTAVQAGREHWAMRHLDAFAAVRIAGHRMPNGFFPYIYKQLRTYFSCVES